MLIKVRTEDLLFESLTYYRFLKELTDDLLVFHKNIQNFKFVNNHQDELDILGREFIDNFSKKIFRIFNYVDYPTFSINNKNGFIILLEKLKVFKLFEAKILQIIRDNFEIIHILKLCRNKLEHNTHTIKFGMPISDTNNFFVMSVEYNNFEYRFTNQVLINLTIQIMNLFKQLFLKLQFISESPEPILNKPNFPNQLLFDNQITILRNLIKFIK